MDWFFKALLTAGTVLLVMAAARRCGHRIAGMVAALPTITAPTLAWLAQERGAAFAASAAVGSVAACAMLAVFALGYTLAARFRRAGAALACGLVVALPMAWPAFAASDRLADALALALACCAIAFTLMPRAGAEVATARHPSHALALAAVTAGGLTAVAATFGPALGSFATGLLSSLPLISGAVAVHEHAGNGHRAAAHFLRGYVGGLFGRAAFGAVFALTVTRVGAPCALTLACAGACACAGAGLASAAASARRSPRAQPGRSRLVRDAGAAVT